jgi:hypothetical protein
MMVNSTNPASVPARLRRMTPRDAEMTALVMALEYYGDAQQYEIVGEEQTRPMILADRGKRARHALGQSAQRALDLHYQFTENNRRVGAQRRALAEKERVITELRLALSRCLLRRTEPDAVERIARAALRFESRP